jgi:mRNA-degrading endonuclease YafQ of YafQ-DinJ toxin-antitoxin module
MFGISITPNFQRQFSKQEEDLKEEILEKLELLKNKLNHQTLKVHKLKGKLSGRYSFSVNYRIRIIFNFLDKDEIILLAVGDHDVYRN